MPEKYASISFTPPQDVRAAARRGLDMRRKYKRGGLSNKEASKQGIGSGVQRATNLANGDTVSPETIGRMVSFFARHEKNKDSKTPSGEPGAGQIAWLLWGGDPGQRWAKKTKRQMEAADMKSKSLAQLASQIITIRSEAPPIPHPLTYKSGGHTGAMIALFLPTAVGVHFIQSDPNALPPNELHITLAYLGKANDLSYRQIIEAHELMRLVSENHPPLTGHINGCGRFCNGDDDGDPFFIIPDLAALPNLRQALIDGLKSHGIEGASDHGFTPHITLTYLPHAECNPFDIIEKTPVTFGAISLVLGDDRYDYPLTERSTPLGKALIEKIGARTKKYKLQIEATGEIIERFERLLAMLAYNTSVGHSANFGMFADGDGADHLKVTGLDLSKYKKELKDFQASCNSIEMAGEDGYYSLKLESRANPTKADLIEKIGARHTGAECGTIQKMHDLSLELGAECHPLTRRAGARHSHADQGLVQRMHDDCVGLGAACKALPERDRVYSSQVLKEGPVTKAQSDAPNYQAASTPQRCANCRFFLGDPGRDWCERFDFTADQDYHCDDWEAQRPDEIPGYVANKANLAALTEGILTLRGGSTSGNWGHAGRKGRRGGSGGGGGFKRIGVKPGSKPSRKKVQAAAKKKGKAAGKKPVTSKKPTPKPKVSPKSTSAKKPATSLKKLDDIFDKAPKGVEKNFTNHLMGKMISGEISLKDAQALTARFKERGSKTTTAPKTGNVKTSKTFTESELGQGAAKNQWGGWAKKLSTQEKDAFKAYSSEPFDELPTDFTQMNNHLRGKDKKPSKETREAIRRVDSGINKGSMPQDTTVFRGFPSSVLGADPSKIVGKTITDKAYTSSSMSERVANQFSKDLIAEIKIPKGAKGAFMDATLTKSDLQQLGRDPEHELLLPRNSKFRILDTKKIGKKTKVFMELVND